MYKFIKFLGLIKSDLVDLIRIFGGLDQYVFIQYGKVTY